MRPVEFKEQNCVYAKNQPEYLPLPVYKTADGVVTSCWQLTVKERMMVPFSGKVWWTVLTFNRPLQPCLPTICNPITTPNQMPENPK
jgi:hypothetical protein